MLRNSSCCHFSYETQIPFSSRCLHWTRDQRLGCRHEDRAKGKRLPAKPLGITLSIKMVGPYMEPADLQIICLLKHKEAGDTYQGAAKETEIERFDCYPALNIML